MNAKVLSAVFKRNLVSYFSSPTGYVFVCVFVLLSSAAAFWPSEFFNRNLANLDQLSKVFPWIMLVFVPAVTMSIWADERRQGTDELLLTIPARDFDIVLGKYLAAVAIYTLSLLFSLVCNLVVLRSLGNPDVGLFIGTYVGYWLVGLAMLAVGMVASFLTANLTVAYILGAVFNVPLVLLAYANSFTLAAGASLFGLKSEQLDELSRVASRTIGQWSLIDRFQDFGRGVISLSGVFYFAAIVVVMLYLSMVLIGRRQWQRGKMLGLHYTVRVVSLALIGLGLVALVERVHARVDVTSERLSSLSDSTRQLIAGIEPKRTVVIDAFVSPEVPESYVQTRLNLLSVLREIETRAGEKVDVRIHNTELNSEEATLAERRYDIKPRRVSTQSARGVFREDQIFLGVAFTSGLQKVIVPFIERGISPEYELVRSLATVTEQKRKKIGVLKTDAPLFSSFDPGTMSSRGESPLIQELKKQYDVQEMDLSAAPKPYDPKNPEYDVVLAVQPSSLPPEQMDNFLAVVRSGQPTAVFEDPFPAYMQAPGTSAPRRPPGGMMGMMGGQRNVPKGDIRPLWNLLGVDFSDRQVVWQNYNPYPRLAQLSERVPELVFVNRNMPGNREPFNDRSEITSDLQHMLFPFPGSIVKLNTSDLQFTPLVQTGDRTGTVNFDEMLEMGFMGGGDLNPNRRHDPQRVAYVLAAEIRGKVKAPQPMAGEEKPADAKAAAKPAAKPQETQVNVVLVADIDVLSELFFRLRERGEQQETGLESFDFDNVTFCLDVLDKLADDSRFLEIRKRRPLHRTLTRIDAATEAASKEREDAIKEVREGYEKAIKEEQKALDDRLADLEKRWKDEKLDLIEVANRIGMAKVDGQKRLDAKTEELKRERDQKLAKVETRLNLEKNRVRDRYKLLAVLLPPILPLAVAVLVFFWRRAQEHEGVSRSRLRS